MRFSMYFQPPRMILLLSLLVILPGQAQAFPVAEGAGAISSLIGVITSVIVGFFPKSGLRSIDKKFTVAVSAAVLAVFIAIGALGWGWANSHKSKDWVIAAAQSRPNVELAGEIKQDMATEVIPQMTSDDIEYAQQNSVFIDLDSYRRGDIASSAARVYLQINASSRYAKPYKTVTPIDVDNESALLAFVREHKGDVLLVADYPATIVQAARVVQKQTGYRLQGIPIRTEAFSLSPERQTDQQGLSEDYPTVHDPEHVFDLPIVDLRTRQNIRETHTLVNAGNITATDFMLMRDSEISALFAGLDTRLVLMGYNEYLYPVIHKRLNEVVPGQYVFYRGGLEKHFLEDGLTITPHYYNMRFVDPGSLIDLYGLTDRVRFVCTVPGTCLDNIPAKDRVELDFRSMDKEDIAAAISALPKDNLYVTVTTGQETYGNSLMTGYWLVNSNHDYLGDLVMPTRFSLEELRARILTKTGYEPSLQEWRQMHHLYLQGIETLDALVSHYGWLTVFACMGFALRLALSPFQIIVFGSYYQANRRILPMLVAALAIPGTLVAAYQFLDYAISYWAVIPHSVMTELGNAQDSFLLPAFVGMITLQILISFPRRPLAAFPIIGLIFTIWLLGWMNALPLPLLIFLMASESVAILLQIPFFAKFMLRIRDERAGIITRPMPEASESDYPAKWFKLTAFRRQPGFLVDLRRFKPAPPTLGRHLRKLHSRKIIVRSAALDAREERLGGYYASHVTGDDEQDVLCALEKIKESGCAFAWVQPYYETDENGVLASISRDGRRAECVYGPGDSATEGSKDAQVAYLDNKAARNKHRAEWRLLRAAERHAKGPVILEYGRLGEKVIPYQLRPMQETTHPEIKLWPQGREGYVLAEDYMARCSRITGDILEEASGGYYKAVRGFLYRKAGLPRRPIHTSRAEIKKLEARAVSLLEGSLADGYYGPAAALVALEEGISILRSLFRASQAYQRPQSIETRLNISAIHSTENHELEILGTRDICLEQIFSSPYHTDIRTHLHDLIVVTTAALGAIIRRVVPDAQWQQRIALCDLRETPDLPPPLLQEDANPLTEGDNNDMIIVAGEISGSPWPATHRHLPPDDGTRWILAGEEISSEWVQELHRFSGILSVYGHPNAHLGLSARALGIPYRRITPEALSVFLSDHATPSSDNSPDNPRNPEG